MAKELVEEMPSIRGMVAPSTCSTLAAPAFYSCDKITI